MRILEDGCIYCNLSEVACVAKQEAGDGEPCCVVCEHMTPEE